MSRLQRIPYRVWRVCLWTIAVAPCLLSLAAVARGSAARPLTGDTSIPALAFDQYLVNLREVSPTREVFAHFAFRNLGQQPVHITALVPSCGCLQPQLRQRDFLPGEIGTFLLRVETANQEPGPHEYRVTVRYTDPQPRERDVVFKVTLPKEQVLVRPAALVFYQTGQFATEQIITVSDLRLRSLNLLGARCSSQYVQTELLPSEDRLGGAGQERQVKITVAASIPPGRRDEMVTIYTDDPDYHELHVPVRIFGPDAPIQLIKHEEPGETTTR